MEKTFSNWLLDIAKYIVTALILSTALSDKMEGWVYYAACFGLVAGVVLLGIYLNVLAERKRKRKRKRKKKKIDKNIQQSNN